MKYLFFSVALMFFLYIFSVLCCVVVNKNKVFVFNSEVFSKDAMTVYKGVAILLIMLAHIGNGFGIRYLTPLGSMGVAVFLFCSGYGLQKSFDTKGLKDFWRKRIVTAYIPYAVFEIVAYVFFYKSTDFQTVALDLLLIDPIHPFGWYMQCLFIYYIAFWFACIVGKRKQAFKYISLLSVAVLMFVFFRSLFKQQLLSFVLGVACAQCSKKTGWLFNKFWFAVFSLFIGVGALVIKQFDFVRELNSYIFYLVEVIQCTALAMALMSICSLIIDRTGIVFIKPVAFIGVISFELYLIHAVFLPVSVTILNISVFFLASLVVSTAVYLIKRFLSSNLKGIKHE